MIVFIKCVILFPHFVMFLGEPVMINALDLLNFVAKNTKNEMIDEQKVLIYIREHMNQSVGSVMTAKIIARDLDWREK